QDERFGAGVNLGQKFFGKRPCRFAEEYALQMLTAAQRFFEQLDAFDGTLTLGGQLGPAECEPQLFQPLVVAAGHGTQTVRLVASSSGLRVLLHRLVPGSGLSSG